MALSKSSTVIALSALAAMAFEVGCGTNNQNGSKQRMHANHTMAGHPAAPATASKNLAVGDKKASTGIASLMSDQATLQSNGLASTDQLVNAKYELQQVQTYYVYHNSHPVEDLGAMDLSTVSIDSTGAALLKSVSGQAFGTMTADSDSPARKLDLPLSFTKKTGWQPSRDGAANKMLADAYVNGTTAAVGATTNGNLSNMFTPAMDQKASVMGILAATQISADKSYISEDENGVKIYLRLLSVDAKTLRIWVSFEEKRANDKATTSNAASEQIDRNIYLDYKITPEAGAQVADAPAAAAEAAPAAADAAAATPDAQ